MVTWCLDDVPLGTENPRTDNIIPCRFCRDYPDPLGASSGGMEAKTDCCHLILIWGRSYLVRRFHPTGCSFGTLSIIIQVEVASQPLDRPYVAWFMSQRQKYTVSQFCYYCIKYYNEMQTFDHIRYSKCFLLVIYIHYLKANNRICVTLSILSVTKIYIETSPD